MSASHALSVARATLLAAGTTYYVFLALLSLVALGYGVTALVGADQIAEAVMCMVAGPDYVTGQILAVDGGRSVQQ